MLNPRPEEPRSRVTVLYTRTLGKVKKKKKEKMEQSEFRSGLNVAGGSWNEMKVTCVVGPRPYRSTLKYEPNDSFMIHEK